MCCFAISTCRASTGWKSCAAFIERPNPPEVIMLTGQATVETAVEAMKLGAYDYLTKPYSITELDVRVKQAAEKRALARGQFAPARTTGAAVGSAGDSLSITGDDGGHSAGGARGSF